MVERNRVIIEGTLGASSLESWSTGINYQGTDGSTIVDVAGLTTWAQAIKDDLTPANYPSLFAFLSASGDVTQVTVQAFNVANTLLQQGNSAPDPTAGAGTIATPFQTSVVFSMRTGVPGQSFRGRNYWPAIGMSVGADGQFGGVNSAPQLALNWVNLLNAITAAYPEVNPVQPVVYSPTLNIVTLVTQVLVGSIPDTQRRRRDNLIELYSSQPYP